MVYYRSREPSTRRLDRTFGALAHPARRGLLRLLFSGPSPVTSLASHFRMSLPAVSKHLGVLQRAGLVHIRHDPADRRVRTCALRVDELVDAEQWIVRTRSEWERRFDALERILARNAKEG